MRKRRIAPLSDVSDESESETRQCDWKNCSNVVTHVVNWTTERRREYLCDGHTERQKRDFSSEILVRDYAE